MPAECIQCYSCRASGSNEVEANIRCLERAYLEDCDDFYQYYNEVEEHAHYYYYEDEQGQYYQYEDHLYDDVKDEEQQKDKTGDKPRGRRKRQAGETPADQRQEVEGEDGEAYGYGDGYEYDYTNMEEYEYPEELARDLTPPTSPSRGAKEAQDDKVNTKVKDEPSVSEEKQEIEEPKPTLPKDPEVMLLHGCLCPFFSPRGQ